VVSLTVQPDQANRSDLIDGFGRKIDHLRLSLTSACDLNCVYCKPDRGARPDPQTGFTDEQRITLVHHLHQRYGLAQVRITGGEPLVYPRTVSLIAGIRDALPDITIAMTTNGRLLYRKGFELRNAGLTRLNISLDSLDPKRYCELTGGRLEDVLRGIDSVLFLGFPPPKINAVVLRGVNDGDIVPLAAWGIARGLEVRFLEAMPIGPAAAINQQGFVSVVEVLEILSKRFSIEALPRGAGETAKLYRISDGDATGIIGTIGSVSEPFCTDCRRIRVTAEGRLYPCLLDHRSTDLTAAWRDGVLDPELLDRALQTSLSGKSLFGGRQTTSMVTLGG